MPDITSLIGAANPYAAGAQALGGLIGSAVGFFQQRKANKLLKRLSYPLESIPKEVFQNQEQAKINANTGLPSEQYNQAMKNIQRQQLFALKSANDRRGGLGLISGLNAQGNNAIENLDVANAKQRLANEQTLMNVNNQVAGWRDKVWDWNTRQKYIRDYNYAMALKGQGNQNLYSGLDKLAAGGGQLLGSGFGGGNNNTLVDAYTPTGTFGYEGYMAPGLMNRNTPNFK